MTNLTTMTMRLAALAMLLGLAGHTIAQQRPDLGAREYLDHCASCHGETGEGDGPLAPHLVTSPSALTTLARRNGGIFPASRLAEVIDGRGTTSIGPHGSREMPVWGQVYRARAAQAGALPLDEDWYARGRLLALLDHLKRIQRP